jgi:hypothetical protein
MEQADFKGRVFLNRDFARSGAKQPGEGAMPAAKGPLIVAVGEPACAPTIELLPGLLSHYPLKLNDILMRDKLRAHFDFFCSDQLYPLSTCFDRVELDVRERELVAFADEPVASWNLMQLHVAKIFIDNAPAQGRAVPLRTIDAFRNAPQDFYQALVAPPTLSRQ